MPPPPTNAPAHAHNLSPTVVTVLGISAGVILIATAAVLTKKLAEARRAMPRPVYAGPWPWPFTTMLDDISGYALRPLMARGARWFWAPTQPVQEDAPPRPPEEVRVEEREGPEAAA